MSNKRSVGTHYENLAVRDLEKKGYIILERNFRCHRDEIDIIAKDGETIVFVEVKYRNSEVKGYPVEAVDYKKQKVISKVALYYLTTRLKTTDVPCRFDVISIFGEKIEHIKNAFEYIG